MIELTARCERGDRWWVVQVDEEPGIITQVRRLDQVEAMVLDACTLFDEFKGQPIKVTVVVDGEPARIVDGALRVKRRAQQADEAARRAMGEAAARLLHMGFTLRDAGFMLGVSYQYVQQLARSAGD